MIDVAQADIDIHGYYSAMEKKEYKELPEYYAKLGFHRNGLKLVSKRLNAAQIPESANDFKRLLAIKLDQLLFKLNGILPENADDSDTATVQSQELLSRPPKKH
ncbi:hypothetical protein GE061_003309 [Apolygus lucorum]|uniref:Uncharacterized protein n=1 Tax=Apolygus lucorum TaxID=248454 RepID=A0A6A4KJT6_APOLU|nr:hypothetical protein GE061_003309 [Apolygus lucorum]